MSLKSMCVENMVSIIKNLPPTLREEVIGESIEQIKKEAEKTARRKIKKEVKEQMRLEIIKEMHRSAVIITSDLTHRLINTSRNGGFVTRPEYTHDIDSELYEIFFDISDSFVNNYAEKLIFD